MVMNILGNSDDTISQTKLYQAVSFYLLTFRSNSIHLTLNKQNKQKNPTTLPELLPNFENCQ